MSNWRDRVQETEERKRRAAQFKRFYECGICDCIHPWDFDGDCRDDLNRFSFDDLPADARVLPMEDRVAADRT